MKKLIIVCIVGVLCGCLSYSVDASQDIPQKHVDSHVYHFPNELLVLLKRELQTEDRYIHCGNPEQALLVSRQFFELEGGKLLVFLELPDYLCYNSNSFIPIVVSIDGTWAWGERMTGEPTFLKQGADQRLWLTTQWQIAATSPTLYQGTDGVLWEPIELPDNFRDLDDCCFNHLTEICFDDQYMRLHFELGYTNTMRYWHARIPASSEVQQFDWYELTYEEIEGKSCHAIPVTSGEWVRREQEDAPNVSFQHRKHNVRVVFPQWIVLYTEYNSGSPCDINDNTQTP